MAKASTKKGVSFAQLRKLALAPLIEQSWRHFAPKKLLAALDETKS